MITVSPVNLYNCSVFVQYFSFVECQNILQRHPQVLGLQPDMLQCACRFVTFQKSGLPTSVLLFILAQTSC